MSYCERYSVNTSNLSGKCLEITSNGGLLVQFGERGGEREREKRAEREELHCKIQTTLRVD